MAYLEELLPEFRKGAKIRHSDWDKGAYLLFDTKEEIIIDQENRVCEFISSDIVSDNWELFEKPNDWDYIIENKCLCWFWNYEEESKLTGILYKIRDASEFKFVIKFSESEFSYIHCRPVRRDEVTFYEDKEDD